MEGDKFQESWFSCFGAPGLHFLVFSRVLGLLELHFLVFGCLRGSISLCVLVFWGFWSSISLCFLVFGCLRGSISLCVLVFWVSGAPFPCVFSCFWASGPPLFDPLGVHLTYYISLSRPIMRFRVFFVFWGLRGSISSCFLVFWGSGGSRGAFYT